MSEKSEKHVVAAFKRALEGLSGCFERLCGEVAELERGRAGHEERFGVLEQELVALADRLNAVELRAGSVVTAKVAEGTFAKVSDLEAH
ncbi:MAG: hypothetical protein ABSB71_11285 [Candidatus Bathyarchaeia archaeon]|jgi:hypothetical protein